MKEEFKGKENIEGKVEHMSNWRYRTGVGKLFL